MVPSAEREMPFWNDAERIVQDAVRKTGEFLPIPQTTITLRPSRHVIYGHGHAGATSEDGFRIGIMLNPDFPDRANLLGTELPRSVSHELHHAARFQALGHTKSLAEAIVREGLAVRFETDVWGGHPSAWATALDGKQLDEFTRRFFQESDHADGSYDHAAWFFGSGDFPRWTGYAVGYELIRQYLDMNQGESAASLFATPASVILDAFRASR